MKITLRINFQGMETEVDGHPKETVSALTSRALAMLYPEEAAPPEENCQLKLGEETLAKSTRLEEADLYNGCLLHMSFKF